MLLPQGARIAIQNEPNVTPTRSPIAKHKIRTPSPSLPNNCHSVGIYCDTNTKPDCKIQNPQS